MLKLLCIIVAIVLDKLDVKATKHADKELLEQQQKIKDKRLQ